MLYSIGKKKRINDHISDEIILSVVLNERLEYKSKSHIPNKKKK